MFETNRDSPRRTIEAIERMIEARKSCCRLMLLAETEHDEDTIESIHDRLDEDLSRFEKGIWIIAKRCHIRMVIRAENALAELSAKLTREIE